MSIVIWKAYYTRNKAFVVYITSCNLLGMYEGWYHQVMPSGKLGSREKEPGIWDDGGSSNFSEWHDLVEEFYGIIPTLMDSTKVVAKVDNKEPECRCDIKMLYDSGHDSGCQWIRWRKRG